MALGIQFAFGVSDESVITVALAFVLLCVLRAAIDQFGSWDSGYRTGDSAGYARSRRELREERDSTSHRRQASAAA